MVRKWFFCFFVIFVCGVVRDCLAGGCVWQHNAKGYKSRANEYLYFDKRKTLRLECDKSDCPDGTVVVMSNDYYIKEAARIAAIVKAKAPAQIVFICQVEWNGDFWHPLYSADVPNCSASNTPCSTKDTFFKIGKRKQQLEASDVSGVHAYRYGEICYCNEIVNGSDDSGDNGNSDDRADNGDNNSDNGGGNTPPPVDENNNKLTDLFIKIKKQIDDLATKCKISELKD
ncbi:MAG: hypothetical protein IJ560_00355 [Alphaproteobacteria bacterium]|nr:hypothetical protein [Alphaproteobacteria bacterium]